LELFPEEVAKQTYSEDLQIIKTGKPIINKEENAKGTWVLTTKMPQFDKNGKIVGLFGISRDITERKKAEEQIRDSEGQLSQLFKRMPSGVAVYRTVNNGEDFVIKDFNEAAERIEHVSKGEIIGKYVTEAFPGVKDFGVFEVFQRVWRTGQTEYFPAALYKDDKDQGTWRESWIYKLPNGNIVAIYRDITERKKSEEERREVMEKLEVTNDKLRVVGGLTRHDVRNKLTAVAGNAYLAREKLSGNSEVLDYLKQIEASVEQIVRIFEFAKAYEMLGVEDLVYVDVEKAVNEAVSLFPPLKDIKVINDCQGLTVLADSLLRQLFYNLIDNSLKYGEKLKKIRVYYEEKNGDHLKVIYEDDGVGLPQATKLKIFHEGFTTGTGSGYGLYLVKKMMEVYGWTIQETGTPGKGTQFTMTIPRIDKEGKENYRLS